MKTAKLFLARKLAYGLTGGLIALTMGLTSNQAVAQCAKYEPAEGCLMIMGQDLDAIGGTANYTDGYIDNVLDETTIETMFPAGVTTYTELTYVQGVENWTDFGFGQPTHAELFLQNEIFDNSFIVIGVDQQAGQLDAVVSGSLDGNIDRLAAWVKRANRPVFIRYGYEFNGQHNGYNATTYKAAYRHFKDRMDAQGVTNAAYVWQEADESENPHEMTQYYPGDDYVDWCGISRFWSDGPNMLQFARQHNKPVMIAEATPKGQRVESNTALWDTWYTQVINLIQNNKDVVKAFAYINQDWDLQPIWQNTFGNSSLSHNPTIMNNWLNEFDDPYYIHSSAGLFDLMEHPVGCFNADFEADQVRIYTGESVTFANRSNGDNTQSWSFGSGASPSTGSGDGPFEITYSTPGLKTVTLTINSGTSDEDVETKTDYIWVEDLPNSCLFSDDFSDGDTAFMRTTYKPVANGAFSISETNGYWSVTAPTGYDEWASYFHYILNDGNKEHSYNFDHPSMNPTISFRIKASAPCAVRVDMEDRDGLSTDADGDWNKVEVTTEWQEVTMEYDGEFYNNYGCGGGGQPCGDMDDHFISALRFYINPGYFGDYFWEGPSGTEYTEMFEGTVMIDDLKVGIGCDGDISPCISKSSANVGADEDVTFESCSGGEITSYAWDFGSGASPSDATGAGPHDVSWGTEGTKTITLTITGANGSKSTTTTVSVSSCEALFRESFDSQDVLDYIDGDAAFDFAINNGVLEVATPTGHEQYDKATLSFHNGSAASTIDMTGAGEEKLWLKMKASGPMAIRINFVDENGVPAQTTDLQGSTTSYSPTSGSFNFPLTTDYQVFEIDFADQWWDEWVSKDELDLTAIAGIEFKPNPGWQNFPIFNYEAASEETVYVDWINVGTECDGLTTSDQEVVRLTSGVYPNPAQEVLFVHGVNSGMYRVVSIMGSTVTQGQLNGRTQISLSELTNGTYLIELSNAQGKQVHRFQKN